MTKLSVLVVAVALTGGCGSPAGSGTETPAGGIAVADSALIAQWKTELIEADRAFQRSVARGGIGAWLTAFSPAGQMIAGGEAHTGEEGIRRAMLPLFADSLFAVDWAPSLVEVSAGGDLGYTIGNYELRRSGDDGAVQESGMYLTAWRRQPDGSWKAEVDIGSAEVE